MLCNDSHTLIWRVILAYLMLKNNVYTTGNTISSIVNTCIRYTIMWAKGQSSVNAVYMMKYIVGSPLIMYLDDCECICTYYLLALLKLRKGNYFII